MFFVSPLAMLNLKLFLPLLLSILYCNLLLAQQNELDSLQTIKIQTLNGSAKLTSLKLSQYDTNQALIQQDRWTYKQVDTGLWARKHYHYEYTPKSRLGQFYTEHHKKDGSSAKKHLHKFKSFRHSATDRVWIKHYAPDGKIIRSTQNGFDENGFLNKVYSKDNSYTPPLIHTESVVRNDLGLMLKWESYDEDQDGKRKVREMNWKYKDDSILLRSSGYVFNDWKETVNDFDKKTGLLKKKTQSYGYRQQDGKIIRNHKNTTTYKNGQPAKLVEFEYKKKFATHKFEYNGNIEIQSINYKDKKIADEVYKFKRCQDSLGNPLLYEEWLNGTLKEKINYSYSNEGKLTKKEDYEYRKSGSVSCRIVEYNKDGRILRKALQVDDRLIKEDLYEYRFYPSPPLEEEDGE